MQNINKIISASLLFAFMLVGVYASGVAMPYWESNPLYLGKGEVKTIDIELQNLVGDNDITFKVSVTSLNNVAQVVGQDTYELKAGERKTLPIRLTVPQDAALGAEYPVTVSVQEVKTSNPGEFSLGSAFDNSFKVIVGEPPKSAPPSEQAIDTKTIIYIIIALIVLAGIIFWLKKQKKSS